MGTPIGDLISRETIDLPYLSRKVIAVDAHKTIAEFGKTLETTEIEDIKNDLAAIKKILETKERLKDLAVKKLCIGAGRVSPILAVLAREMERLLPSIYPILPMTIMP